MRFGVAGTPVAAQIVGHDGLHGPRDDAEIGEAERTR